tara:strand:+ start:500 stop:1840 length:1341 start_codon:yes stop_codon:yes gene_type:complete
MKKRLFPLLITLSALAVSGSAAFYSVFGLSKLFAGASTQVIIMAGSLEFAKLVVASLLYQYWDTINKWLRSYLLVACFVLMIITSGGIYGFLSGAYQSTATQSELLDKSLSILNQRQTRFEETKEDLTLEKTQINKSISDLRISLSNPTSVSYWDENSQTVITTTSSSTRRALQAELKTTITDRDNLNIKLEAVLDSIGKTDMVLLNKEITNESESELGPLKYLSETTGYPMNQVVNWFLLLIIFVFDPLAIALVVASNMAFAKIKKPEDSNVVYEKSQVETDLDDTIDKDHFSDLQDYIKATTEEQLDSFSHPKIPMDIPTHNPQTGEVNPYYKELTGKENPLEEENEKRMDIIGQNGNDGLHYDQMPEHLDADKLKKEEPINPTEKDLEKLAKALNISYSEDGVPMDRLTDTTQTLATTKNEDTENYEKNDDSKTTLRYSKRRV